MVWYSAFTWLVHAALATTILMACGTMAVLLCRQPADRLRVIQCTLLASLAAMCVAAVPVSTGWSVAILPEVTGQSPPSSAGHSHGVESSGDFGSAPSASKGWAARDTDFEQAPLANETAGPQAANFPLLAPSRESAAASRPTPAADEDWIFGAARTTVLVFLAGALVMVVRWIRATLLLRRLRRDAHEVPTVVASALERIAGPPARRVLLLQSDRISAPITWGVLRPVIVLPSRLSSMPEPGKLRYCLAHEWAHIARRDMATWTLATLVQFVLYYQPLYWWLRRRLALSMDELADAVAAKHGPSTADYAGFLLELARRRLWAAGSRPPAPALGISDKRSRLCRRVLTLLKGERPRLTSSRQLSLAAMISAILLAGTVSAVRLDAEPADDASAGAAGELRQHARQNAAAKPVTSLDFATGWGGRFKTQESNIDDKGLVVLEQHPDLVGLELGNNPAVTDVGLKHLAGLSNLQRLYLHRTSVEGPGLAHVGKLKNLEYLSLSHTPLTDEGLAQLTQLPKLKWLVINNTPVSDEALRHISQMKSLRELQVSHTDITDAGLRHLASLPNLEKVSAGGTYVTAEGVEALQEALPNCQIYPPPEKLRAQPQDIALWPEGRKPSRAELLAAVKKLERTGPPNSNFGATAEVEVDSERPGKPIVSFTLTDSHVSDATLLRILNEMPDLEQLNLRYVLVGDELGKELPRFTKLHFLALADSRISDEGLKFVGRLPNLRELDLHGNDGISDAGLVELRRLTKLEDLYISDTRLSNRWLFLLQSALPNCRITH